MFDLFNIPFLENFPPGVREWVTRTLIALVVFGIILLLRRLLTWVILAPFRALTRRSKTNLDNTLMDVVEPATGYIVVALALLLSTQILTVGNVELLFIQRLARTLIIVGVAVALFQSVNYVRKDSRLTSFTGLTIDEQLLPFVRTGLKIILVALALVIVIQEWGYNVSGLIAGLGLGGLAFSLAAQDTVSNLFGFSTIVGDRPFVVGEYVITSNAEGIIEKVGVRSTKIRTLDQSLIIVPNNVMANSTITNWSRLTHRRYNFTIGITYSTNSQQMRALLSRIREALAERELVDNETIVVHFTEFSSSSLDILVRCNVNTPAWGDWVAEREQINLAIMDVVHELGLSMAFPSRSLYIESMPSPNAPVQIPERDLPVEIHPHKESQSSSEAQQDEGEDSPSSGI